MKLYNEEIIGYENNTVSMFRKFGERVKELRESKAMESEGTYRKTIRKLAKELMAAKGDLECLQRKHLISDNVSESSRKVDSTVTKEELGEASIRLTLARKVMEEFGVNRSEIEMLMG